MTTEQSNFKIESLVAMVTQLFVCLCLKCLLVCVSDPQCLGVSTILSSHGMSQDLGVTVSDFSFLCPALLHQIEGGACIHHGNTVGHGARGSESVFHPCYHVVGSGSKHLRAHWAAVHLISPSPST